ncbi:MAG: DUF3160 domain-containing protein [Firmicutes bacterium]|nr:DUF3160 domain-containing protein [Bacillota bacterium]
MGCGSDGGDNGMEAEDGQTGDLLEPPFFAEKVFAHYREVPVDISPSLAAYQVGPGLANISNRDPFHFSPAAEELLVRNGFVVVPNAYREFFGLYEMNRYEPVPSFITTDSMLHNFHLFFSHLLRVTEKEKLAPALYDLTQAMLAESQRQYEILKGTPWENAAARNMGFFAVGGRLLNADFPVPGVVQDVVAEELRLIEAQAGIQPSPLMNWGQDLGVLDALLEDYSQYIPRGHYDSSQELEAYFKAMMWYGRMTFRFKSEDETRSALLLTLALSQDDNAHQWDQIYQPTAFFVGRSDDLSYHEYRELLTEIYGEGAGLEEVAGAEDKWEAFLRKAVNLRPPLINSIPIFEETIQPDGGQEIRGFRFLGQRFTLDAAIFQRLLYREVGENKEGQRRMLPRALDIPAALGSEEALAILTEEGETDYRGYEDNMGRLQEYSAGLGLETWTQNLYWGWRGRS